MRYPAWVRRVSSVPLVISVVVLAVSVMQPAVASADGGDPIGAFDYVSRSGPSQYNDCYGQPCQPVHSVWELAGWAADPDAPDQHIHVHVYLDGVQILDRQTGLARPDVAAAYPWAGGYSGWDFNIIYIHDDAAHTLCVYAINVGAGTENATLGCRSLQAGVDDPGDPRGYVDTVTATAGAIRLQGWAGDPDPDATQPTVLDSYLDGQPFISFTGNMPRDDVHAVFPELANAEGFDQALPVMPGVHILCVDAINGGQGGSNNPSLGCWGVDVPAGVSPGPNGSRGSFDATVYHPPDAFLNYSYSIEGWAWDPTASPPVVRDRYVERASAQFWPGYFERTVEQPTSEPRPDVQGAFPGAPPNTGFKISFTAPGIGTPYTPYHGYDCLYIETAGGEDFLGCHPLQTIHEK